MIDLSTSYLGLELKNPIIVGSSSLTSSIENIIQLEVAGAAAVVLNSLFEEEIIYETGLYSESKEENKQLKSQITDSFSYIRNQAGENRLSDYLSLIKSAKTQTTIPIIASINCITDSEWIEFTNKIQDAGADALELNLFFNPIEQVRKDYEKLALEIVKKIKKTISIPISIKLSDCYTNLSGTIIELSNTGIAGLVLFNKYYSLDIDIYNMKMTPGRMHSSENDYVKSLRWIALLSKQVKCSLAASTGIHNGNTLVKQILAGADAIQVVSALYLNGKDHIARMLGDLKKWMFEKGIFSVTQFKGKASYKNHANPAVYERIEFMKHYGRIVYEPSLR